MNNTIRVCLGRFQPFTKGHLKMVTYKTGDKDIDNQKTIIFVVSTPKAKVNARHPFDDDLMRQEFDILKRQYQDAIEDIIYVKSADIVKWGSELVKRNLQASVWLTGSDEFKMYNGMAKKIDDYQKRFPECKGGYADGFHVVEIERSENKDFESSISGTKVRQTLKDNDKDTFTKMMPDGTDKLFNEFKEALSQLKESRMSLSDYIIENLHRSMSSYIIRESGSMGNPIPVSIAPVIYTEVEKKIHSKYPDLEMSPLGSFGKKTKLKDDGTENTHGDIDIAVRIDNMEELKKMVDDVFPKYEYAKNPTLISLRYPYDIDGKKDDAQIDLMIVKNMNWSKVYWHSPDFTKHESKYKGGLRTSLLATIISEIPIEGAKDEYFDDNMTVKRHWKYTFNADGVFKQLLDYTGKKGNPLKNPKKLKEFEQLVTNDPDNMVHFVFGENGSMDDIKSAESLWKAIHDPKKFKWQEKVPAIEKRFYEDVGPKNNADLKDFPKS